MYVTGQPKPDYKKVEEDPVAYLGEHLRRLKSPQATAVESLVAVPYDSLKTVLDFIESQDARLGWYTTCENCSALWDKVYELDMGRQELRAKLEGETLGTS